MGKISADRTRHTIFEYLSNALLISSVVATFALVGIVTRPSGLLAAFWPANAVLVGIFLRSPKRASGIGWVSAGVTFFLVDLLTGTTLFKSIILNSTNILSVAVCYGLFNYVAPLHTRLQQTNSIIVLLLITAGAALTTGLIGALVNPLFSHGSNWEVFLYWATSELVNYLAILPVILTLPPLAVFQHNLRRTNDFSPNRLFMLLPATAVLFGCLVGLAIGGPATLSYTVPGLLWCAISYGTFLTALLTLLSSMWLLIAASSGHLNIGTDLSAPFALESFRIGVTLIALTPLAVASVMSAREKLVKQIKFAANHDHLTKALNRGGFMNAVLKRCEELKKSQGALAVLMLDIDHFKRVNDQHGHACGDDVLVAFTGLLNGTVRKTDIVGRLGGEEFAVVLSECTEAAARCVAQGLCDAVANHVIKLSTGLDIKVTVSIGLVYTTSVPDSLDELLVIADQQLYKAKTSGRNVVV